MADTLVERLTGQTKASDVNVELQLMMPLDSLIKPNDPSAAGNPRLRPAAPGAGVGDPHHQSGTQVVAPPLHRTQSLD